MNETNQGSTKETTITVGQGVGGEWASQHAASTAKHHPSNADIRTQSTSPVGRQSWKLTNTLLGPTLPTGQHNLRLRLHAYVH